MTQFHLHFNASPGAPAAIPYLIDLQSPLLTPLQTRIVAPVYTRHSLGAALPTELSIELEVDGEACVAMLPEMAAIPARYLGPEKQDLSAQRLQWIRAVDILITEM